MIQASATNGHSAHELNRAILHDGFAVIPGVLLPETASQLDTLFTNSTYGERNLLELPEIRQLATSNVVKSLVTPILGDRCFAVRGILFDKTAEANWNVAWHQDRVIAVRARQEVHGFRAWTLKAGVHHVQPPAEIVTHMLAIRLHLDDCGKSNGPLHVIPGSHLTGYLSDIESQEWKQREQVICSVSRGDAIVMRPLLLHSSLRSDTPQRRRVIHIEFSSHELPSGLEWHTKVA